MFKLIGFLTKLFKASEIEPQPEHNVIPAKEAKEMWENRHGAKGPKMKTEQPGLDLIESFEGLRLTPYLDSKGIPTIGIGTTHYEDGKAVTMHDSAITEARAYELLSSHLKGVESCVNSVVTSEINQNQFDALACFTYNVGQGNFMSSTLLKKINASDFEGAAEEFMRWNKAGGQVLAGLTRRRQAEKDLFLS